MNLTRKKFSPFVTISLFLIGLLTIYAHLLWIDPVLSFDDHSLIKNLQGEYKFIDIQPIRDLSLLFDIFLKKFLGLSTFHLSNFFIWIACIYLIYKTLINICIPFRDNNIHYYILVILFIYSIHPLFVYSVAWISARKHLLSFLFTLMCTCLTLSVGKKERIQNRDWIKLSSFYILAIFSQPISVLWPIWFGIFHRKNLKSILKKYFFFLIIPMFAALLLNIYYYSTVFTGHQKFSSQDNHLALTILSLGRYVFNFFIPIKIAISYSVFSKLNFYGAGLGIILYFLIKRKICREDRIIWFSYFFLMLLPVTLNQTDYFISNPYILNASLAIIVLITIFLKSTHIKPVFIFISGTIISSVLIFLSLKASKYWLNSHALYQQSFKTEGDYRSTRMYLISQLNQQEIDYTESHSALLHLALITKGQDPIILTYTSKLVLRAYESEVLSIGKKIQYLEQFKIENPFSLFFLAKLYSENNQCQKATPITTQLQNMHKVELFIKKSQLTDIQQRCK